ncbi:DoxX family protein [Leeuwenhoekiella aequorea]|uniref:DoxX-like protein n=1 Tax=Leeuwenhoekiella aequorea TaxID=283736 RepID=A0A4Q0PA81_9FLAO|nr:DoxX family protein [Leeuwenhoekiella aequorea]RXG23421.1 DoxX-like protein [Leeuwenhoekiella aequorea]
MVYQGLALITGLSFILYGMSCLTTQQMINEFDRFNLSKWRILVGYLQIMGGAGLLIGLFLNTTLVIFSAGGLSLLMFMGFITRLYIKDGFIKSSPAFIFMLVNAIIVFGFWDITFGI